MATRGQRTARPGSAAPGGHRMSPAPRAASSDNERVEQSSGEQSDAENCLEAVRLRLHLLRSRMRDVKKTADTIKLTGSELQTEVRRRCGDLMRALEERQHVMVEAVISEQERKLDALQRQANSIDSEAQQLLKTEAELEANIVAAEAARLESKSGSGRGGKTRANVPRALIEAMRAAVERRPEEEVHGPVPCTPATFQLTLATEELLRQLLSLDFQERQTLMAPKNVTVTRETRHSLKIEWVAPPTIPSFPVCGYSVLVSEDDGTAEGGHPDEEMRSFQRGYCNGELEAAVEQDNVVKGRRMDNRGAADRNDRDEQDCISEDEDGYDIQVGEGQAQRGNREPKSLVGRCRAMSADRRRNSRPASAFGSSPGTGAVSAAARRNRSAGRVRHDPARRSQASLSTHKVSKHQRRGVGTNDNAPLLRFEAWGLKADTPYRFHIQAVNGQGRGLWVREHPPFNTYTMAK